MCNLIQRLCGCCLPSPIKIVEKKHISRVSFDKAIGNMHKRDKSTDVMTLKKFVQWKDSSINEYMKNRNE